MFKQIFFIAALLTTAGVLYSAPADSVSDFTPEEAAVVAAIKAQNASDMAAAQTVQDARSASITPTPAETDTAKPDDIKLPEETKQQAFKEAEQLSNQATAAPEKEPVLLEVKDTPQTPAEPAKPGEEPQPDDKAPAKEMQKCLTVAFIDIDEAFNQHPRTVAVKEQIRLKILSKEQEVEAAKQIIDTLQTENATLTRLLKELKPFYRRIVVQPEMAPKIKEAADSLLLGNVLNQLCFSRCEILTTTPLNTPEQVDDLAARMASNQKIIAERSFFIDNYKYTTREEILKLEEKEVKAILKDIYTEIKSFAKKRNIGAVVRKDEILYGEKPVNVTKDFVNRLKKSKKYRDIRY